MLDGQRTAIIAAHPDDETVGMGGSLAHLREIVFVHVTDGAPCDMRDATAYGFGSREEYAEARRQEFFAAIETAKIRPIETLALNYADQQSALHLREIALDMLELIERLGIDTVFAHPYEGGHPDHDAVAFAVHAACRLMPAKRMPRLIEFTSYHARGAEMETGVFLPDGASAETVLPLGPPDSQRKRRMLDCFRTQQAVLRPFGVAEERFRKAPVYDFTRPPQEGQLYYERFPWGMTKERWLGLVQSAREELGLC
jgi:LmbE family N-acetylglucosaminyl deacetylase